MAASLTNGSSPTNGTTTVVPVPLISTHKRGGGALIATVLSVYDLPSRDPPLCVSLQTKGSSSSHLVVRTGPPSSRHKDRNSFRFLAKQTLRLEAPLRALYPTEALLTVEYSDASQNLTATVQLKTLPIQETTWLILNLEPANPAGNTDDSNNDKENTLDNEVPSLRVQMRLEGPYRMEIGALVHMAREWFGLMDSVGDSTRSLVSSLPSLPSAKVLLVPAVPLAAAGVVLAPVLIGILVVGLPVFLPLLVAVLSLAAGGGAVGVLVWASTKAGRSRIGGMCAPLVHTVLSTPAGQVLVYETGPRPTPVSVAHTVLPTDLFGKLFVSLLIDLLGSSSYLLPVVGEAVDVAWAPIQTILIMAMYDHVSPNLKYVSFVEEILPFTDVVPSATIGWLSEFGPEILPGILGGGANGNKNNTGIPVSSNSQAVAPRM